MKNLAFALLFATSFEVQADPHFVQALHPYWGFEEHYIRYMEPLKEPVNAYVTTYDGRNDPDDGEVTHLYFYAINIPGSTTFSLDIACPERKYQSIYGVGEQASESRVADIGMVASDPVRKNPKAAITTSHLLSWPLDPAGGKQGMWFYSSAKISERTYVVTITSKDGKQEKRSGAVQGPSCLLE